MIEFCNQINFKICCFLVVKCNVIGIEHRVGFVELTTSQRAIIILFFGNVQWVNIL